MTAEIVRVAVVHADDYGQLAVSIASGRGLNTHGIAAAPRTLNLADILPWMETREVDQLWLSSSVCAVLDSAQPEWRTHHIAQCSWKGFHTEAVTLDGWAVFVHPGTYGLRHVVCQRPGLPFGDVQDGKRLAQSLYAFADALGTPFYRSPGATGTGLMRAVHHHKTDLSQVGDFPPPALMPAVETDTEWCPPLADPDAFGCVRSYDRNAQYLSAAGAVTLGFGPWEHLPHGLAPNEKVLAGYYYVRPRAELSLRLPSYFHPLGREQRGERDGWLWVTAPSYGLGRQYDLLADVGECYVWRTGARVLDQWYQRLRDARAALMESDRADREALDVLKLCYTHAIGWLASRDALRQWREGGRLGDLVRPDWRQHIIGLARANLYRRLVPMVAGGAQLLGVHVDDVFVGVYAPDAPHPAGVSVGTGLADFKMRQMPARAVLSELRAMASADPRERRRGMTHLRAAFDAAAVGGRTHAIAG